MFHPEPNVPRRPSQTPRSSRSRRPGPRAVIYGSLSLFAVLFALLTFQLSASAGSASTALQRSSVATRKAASAEAAETTAAEAEEAAEAVAEEEIEPVVTSSS